MTGQHRCRHCGRPIYRLRRPQDRGLIEWWADPRTESVRCPARRDGYYAHEPDRGARIA